MPPRIPNSSVDVPARQTGGPTRRAVLASSAGLLPLAGCIEAPSSSSPPYEAVEIDDGPVFEPGLASEIEEAFYAALLLGDAARSAFDRTLLDQPGQAFLADTDFDTHLLGLVQVAGVNSSTHLDVVDLALTQSGFTVVLALRDDPAYTDDRVITTLLVRVPRKQGPQPDRIWVELGIGGRDVSVSGSDVIG